MLFVFLLEYNFYSQFFRNDYIHLKINKITYWSKTINKKPLKQEILINNPPKRNKLYNIPQNGKFF